jgi:hypothetical protein
VEIDKDPHVTRPPIAVLAVVASFAALALAADAAVPGSNGPLVIDVAFYADSCGGEDEFDALIVDPGRPRVTSPVAGPDAEHPLVAPDGSALAYTGNGGYVETFPARKPRQLDVRQLIPSHGLTVDQLLAWSPDEHELLATVHREGSTARLLRVLGRRGRVLRRVRVPGLDRIGAASWSIGGLLALDLGTQNGSRLRHHVAIIGNNGAGPMILLHHAADAGLDWSPDGHSLAWSDRGRVFTANRFGRGPARAVVDGKWPVWSPDGTTLAAIRGMDIVIVAPNSRVRTVRPGWVGLEAPPNAITGLQWAPRGAFARTARHAHTTC